MDRVERAKQKADESAYKRGLKSGWEDGLWFLAILSVAVAVIAGWPY